MPRSKGVHKAGSEGKRSEKLMPWMRACEGVCMCVNQMHARTCVCAHMPREIERERVCERACVHVTCLWTKMESQDVTISPKARAQL